MFNRGNQDGVEEGWRKGDRNIFVLTSRRKRDSGQVSPFLFSFHCLVFAPDPVRLHEDRAFTQAPFVSTRLVSKLALEFSVPSEIFCRGEFITNTR